MFERINGRYVLDVRDARLEDVFQVVSKSEGVKLQVDEALAGKKITVRIEAKSLEDLLSLLSESRAFVYERDGAGYKLAVASVAAAEGSKRGASALPDPIRGSLNAKMSVAERELLKNRGVLFNSSRSLRTLLRPNSKAIVLQNALIDTETVLKGGPNVEIPDRWMAHENTKYFIVQFDRPLTAEDRAQLEQAGVRVSHYVPHQAVAVYGDWKTIRELKATNSDVRFVEPFHPYFKLSPELLAYFSGRADEAVSREVDKGRFHIMVADATRAELVMQSVGGQILRHQEVHGRLFLTIEVPPKVIPKLAHDDAVQWIEIARPMVPMNDLSQRRIGVRSLKALHPNLNGGGVIIGVTDTGVDFVNPGFAVDQTLPTSTNMNTRIVHYAFRPGSSSDGVPGDNNGHGTHVSGTILGNGALSQTVPKAPGSGIAPYATNLFAGVAPLARLVMIEDFNSFSDSEQAQIAYTHGARISNNSWGNSVYTYGTYSAIWDALVRDAMENIMGSQELIAFFAAGNDGEGEDDGTGGSPSTVGEPANAKNVIAVGAVEQIRYANNLLSQNSEKETDSDWQVASFSSRGPVDVLDPRVKPDIMAPGSYVLSIQSHETMPDDLEQGSLPHRDYRYGNLDSGTNFAFLSGTSMATPVAAGAGALIYQYFTNFLGRAPSPAMMKAVLVAGARFLNTLFYRHPALGAAPEQVDEGWGLLDVVRSLHGIRPASATGGVVLLDQDRTSPLNTGQIFTAPQIVLGAEDGGLKVVLAWSDVPGTPGNAIQLVNDLDLVVMGPNGLVYHGNLFDSDGVNSYPYSQYSSDLADRFNNVEVVIVPDGKPGTYTIQVRGYQVPQGPQNFALAIVKGIGHEGRMAGEHPALALTTNALPIVAYSGLDANSNRQIYVRRWVGSLEDSSRLGEWGRLDDHWYGLRGSADGSGISKSFEKSTDPSIAVQGTNVYVAWVESPRPPETVSFIFLKQFNGRDWVELANSARGTGLSGPSAYDASAPVVKIGFGGYPIVAFERQLSPTTGERVFVKRWNGSSWTGLAGSDSTGLPVSASYPLVDGITMDVDISGYPVVAWGNSIGGIEVRRWTGSAWANIGPIGFSPFASQPSLVVSSNNLIYIAWVQLSSSYVPPYVQEQIFVARYSSGTNWVALGSSMTFPGVSASTNLTPQRPSISVGRAGSVHVAWEGVATNNAAIVVKRWDGASGQWVLAGNCDEQYGIARQQGTMARPVVAVDMLGIPVVAFQLGYAQDLAFTNEVMVYTLYWDREPPTFAGLGSARGGTNNNVFLAWDPAVDSISSSILYRIYRSTQTWACGAQPECSASDVFANLIATVTNATNFTVTGLVPNRVYCFAVRAVDTNGFMEMNTVIRSAGPITGSGDNDNDCLPNAVELTVKTEPCIWDTDGDGMPDGWEWHYSTNNPSHTNVLAMDPLDNGVDKIRTVPLGDGDPTQSPDYDLDADGATSREEYQWYVAYTGLCLTSTTNLISPDPTRSDTDGDGMSDGWEITIGFNPINPADAALDADGDGLSNLQEFQRDTDPYTTDSDGDGLLDGFEVGLGLDPALADTDYDGLTDSFEISLGSDPRNGDTANRMLSDGAAFQLGWGASTAAVYNILLKETFETSTRTNWTHGPVNAAIPWDLWHLSTADPSPNLSGVRYVYERSTNVAYRFSKGTNFEAAVTNNYSGYGALQAALNSPVINATNVSTLFVAWNEYYYTEPNGDFVQVMARGGGSMNWVVVAPAVSGKSGISDPDSQLPPIWVHRTADISRFAGQSNVQIRFLFRANAINNEYPGWYVDDVVVYEGVRIGGWVRGINGAPIAGARVVAMGRGGITNYLGGHRIIPPAEIFGEAITSDDGSYEIRGLPQGRYYLQASAPGYIAEFYNGPLFTGSYAFGAALNPGVSDRFLVGPNGWLNLTNAGAAIAGCHFELEPGRGRAYLGVMMSRSGTNRYPVTINGATTNFIAHVWNGVTNPVGAALQPYLTVTNAILALNRPDWLTNATVPSLLGDYDVGNQEILPPTNFAFLPSVEVSLREGDATWVDMGTNHAQGWVKVTAADGAAYQIWVDYRQTTNVTPASFKLPAGSHTIMLNPTNVPRIAPKRVEVPRGTRVTVTFSTNDLRGATGKVWFETFDLRGNVVTGATIYINGQRLSATTPGLVDDLLPGVHRVTVTARGYRRSGVRSLNVNNNSSNRVQFVLADADEDFDRVGDLIEVVGYTNVFLYHRNSDPDSDGLANLFEYEQLRLHNVFLNPFHPDSDRDNMPDSAELGHDGQTNLLGLSVLETNAVQGSTSVRALFVGRYLEGVCNFGTSGPIPVSIEGDRFVAGTVAFPMLSVPTSDRALMVFGGISTTGVHQSVSVGHNKDATVFSDARPDRRDTDGDGMWDGFEWQYGAATAAGLDPIEAGRAHEDPDFDGINNFEEFLGPDFVPNTNDWTSAISSDTDGDSMPDGWEYFYGFDPNNAGDGFEDPDADGLVNSSEFYAGTNPKLKDTDGDFVPDYEEVVVFLTDPLDLDTDYDGLLDGREVWDRTGDGVFDGGFFPNWDGGDMDVDGYMDGPTDWDTDGDGMPDGFEVIDEFGNLRNDSRLDPANPNDADDDPDGDGLSNLQEYLVRDTLYGNNPSGTIWDYSTDPFRSDSDGDGMPDGWEVIAGLHPMDPVPTSSGPVERYSSLGPMGDLDNDGLWNYREYAIRFHYDMAADSNAIYSLSTNPWNPDTDEDGLTDGQEDRAFLSHAIKQDTDVDRLMDGVSVIDRWGETESVLRQSEYEVRVCTNCTWSDAATWAIVPHPKYPHILGHLAVINGESENTVVAGLISGTTNVAIGGRVGAGGRVTWINREAWLGYANWDASQPSGSGAVGMWSTGMWFSVAETSGVFGEYVIEWDYVPVVTNHYDQALNDVWLLKWPVGADLPRWERANVSTNTPWPAPRWGQAATYIPVFETKKPRNDRGNVRPETRILLDNRQMVIFGGRDGVTTHKDVWELNVRSNEWAWSAAPLNSEFPVLMDGLSELQAFTIFGYKNTGCVGSDSPWWDSEEFARPKNRPWSDSRSFDWTYLFGGWDDYHRYYEVHLYYKSTDDPRAITEGIGIAKGVTEFLLWSPTGGNYRFASSLNIGTRFFIGGAGGAAMPDEKPEESNSYIRTGYAALQVSDFTLRSGCDEIINAVLQLDVVQPPATPLSVDVLAEISRNLGHSDVEYSSDPDEKEPYQRHTNTLLYFQTSTTNLIIPTGGGIVTLDITELVRAILLQNNWDSTTLGFVFVATNASNAALIRVPGSGIQVAYKPSYKVAPYWDAPTAIRYVYSNQKLSKRKGMAMAYDYKRKRSVIFGGIDGNNVLGDTHEGLYRFSQSPTFNPRSITYFQVVTPNSPSPRWGASLVYDRNREHFVLFGGFNANHHPLNDLWIYKPQTVEETIITREDGTEEIVETITAPAEWIQVVEFGSLDRPQPRGGASMVYWGDFDYDRGMGEYCISGNKKKIVMFGGTDGKSYFNDTWVYDYGRWILVNPVGEQSQGPTPRAFASLVWAQNADTLRDPMGDSEYNVSDSPPCTGPAAILFGGRTGTLLGGEDTDMDLVEDGAEYELGGPQMGRDPRVNRLVQPDQTNESLPYVYLRIGPRPSNSLFSRGAIANFESLRHDDGGYACSQGLPWENHPDMYSGVRVSCGFAEPGVEASRVDETRLWYHRYGLENPFDPKDVWELGRPDNAAVGAKASPPYAHSGRWCYGTDLDGLYPNNAIMELYSPLLDLSLPSPMATATNNFNSYFLVFWEWVDLFDSNDVIRIDAVRPETSADINTRVSGRNRPVLPVLPNRNCAHNTTGRWRKMVVPLDHLGGESNVYLRFTMQSDSSGVAGGWYIDDVAIMQGWEIFGSNLPPFVLVSLYGTNINGHAQATTITDANGNYMFGFLPVGAYNLGVLTGSANINSSPGAASTLEITNISPSSVAKVQWPALPGLTYRVDYADPVAGPHFQWYPLVTVLASGVTEEHTDPAPQPGRIYRVVILGGP